MEKFNGNSYSTHGNFRVELFVILLAVVLVVLVVFPKAVVAFSNIKINSVIESFNSYKESVNNYYVSQLLFDNSFKLDGRYYISDGALIFDDNVYDISVKGNVPSSGYVAYENNLLKNGCVVVDSYSVVVEDGKVVSVNKGECDMSSSFASADLVK